MNERIRQLAVQARQEFLSLQTGYQPEQVGMYPQLMEKFAESIVEECIRYFNEDYVRNFDILWREDLSVGLKGHFGVK